MLQDLPSPYATSTTTTSRFDLMHEMYGDDDIVHTLHTPSTLTRFIRPSHTVNLLRTLLNGVWCLNRLNVIREAAKKDIFLVARPLRKKNLKP